jgi:hypothetical protein
MMQKMEKKLEELSISSNNEMKSDDNNEIEGKELITEIERKESNDIIPHIKNKKIKI